MESRRTDLAWLVGLLVAATLLPWALAAVLGLDGPAGTDPALWTLTVLDLEQGVAPVVSPLYPWLAAWFHAGSGQAVSAAALVTVLATAVVGPLTYVLARVLGARPVISGPMAGLALLSPAVAGFSVRVSPDALVVAAFLVAALAGALFLRRPAQTWRLVAVCGVGALAPLLREHGLILAAALGVVLAWAPGTPAQRGFRVGLLAAGVLLAPALVGTWPDLPWELGWNGRLTQPVGDLAGEVPKYAGVLRPELYDRLANLYAEDRRLGIVLFHLEWALRQSPGTWVAVFGALASLPRLRATDRAAAASLVPVLPALVIWSAPRHVGVALPVALAVLGAAWGPWVRVRGRAWVVGAGAAVLLLLLGLRWTVLDDALREEARALDRLEVTGRALCAQAGPGDLAAGEAEAFVYCPLPAHGPGTVGTAADWHTWWVVYTDSRSAQGKRRRPELPWARVWLEVPDRFAVYRLAPWVGRRPCDESRPVGTPAYFAPSRPRVDSEPPCQVDPWSYGPAPASVRKDAEGVNPSATDSGGTSVRMEGP